LFKKKIGVLAGKDFINKKYLFIKTQGFFISFVLVYEGDFSKVMDRLEFEFILRENNRRIFNYLLKILRNQEDAEDILQDVFIAFYHKMENINENAYQSYLYKTAYNKALNLIKSRKKKKNLTQEQMIYKETQKNEQNPNNEKNEILKKAFNKLPPKYAILLELQFYQKMSYKEIAKKLSTTISAVDSKLVRAKKKLKKIISQDMKENFVF